MARILDLTDHSAVYSTRLFVEAGHEVIRLEPRQGDEIRRLGPYLGGKQDLEHGAYHHFLNAGKKSLTLDTSTPAGRSLLLELCQTADAVIASAPLPLEEAAITACNPRLVLTVVSDGDPELCAYARSGLLAITGHPGQRPVLMGGHVVYAATGLYVAAAAAAALYVAEQTGEGQVVRVSVEECLQSLAEQAMVTYISTGKNTERRGYRGAVTAVSGAFPTEDGYWMISVPHTPEGWRKFMEWVQDPVLMEDESLVDEAERAAKKDFILDRLEKWSARFRKEEQVAESQRRHIPASPVATPLDLARDPQLIARGFLQEVDHPEFGRTLLPVGALASLRGTRVGLAPTLGQHNAELLAELGYSAEEQRALIESGTV